MLKETVRDLHSKFTKHAQFNVRGCLMCTNAGPCCGARETLPGQWVSFSKSVQRAGDKSGATGTVKQDPIQ